MYLDRFPSVESRLIVIWSTWPLIFLSETNSIFARFVECFGSAALRWPRQSDCKNSEEKQQISFHHRKSKL